MNSSTQPLARRLAYFCLWLFVFSMPIEKAIQIPGLGTISKLAGLIALGVGLLAIVLEQRFRVPGQIQVVLAVFVLWSALTLRWSIGPEWTVERIITYVQLLSLVLLVWEFCAEETQVMGLLSAYVLGTLVPAGDTVQRFLLGRNTYYNRYATTGFDPNDLALTLALSLPMSYYLTLRTKNGPLCWIYRVQMIAAIGTTFLTASRGGTFCMLIALSLIVWTLPYVSARQRAGIVVVMVVMIIGAVALVPPTSWKRLASAANEVSQGTLNSRTVLWKAGFTAFETRAIGGIGSGAYPEASAKFIGRPWGFVPVAHNSFISVLVETGVIGLAIFGSMLGMLWRSTGMMSGMTRSFWLTLLAVWTVGVCSLTWEYRKPTWLVFGLAAAHIACWTRPVAEPNKKTMKSNSHFAMAGAWS